MLTPAKLFAGIAAEIRKVMGENDQIISEDFENFVRDSGMREFQSFPSHAPKLRCSSASSSI